MRVPGNQNLQPTLHIMLEVIKVTHKHKMNRKIIKHNILQLPVSEVQPRRNIFVTSQSALAKTINNNQKVITCFSEQTINIIIFKAT